MAKITIEDIHTLCKIKHWICTDKLYVNLKTPMHFICPNGHDVEITWEKLRNKFKCPICSGNFTKTIVNVTSKPKTNEYRILALDQSSHKTGYSVYDNKELIAYGVYDNPGKDYIDRIIKLNDWLESMILNWKPDAIGMEETQYNPKGVGHDVFKLLSQVMGSLILTCARKRIDILTVLIPTWRHYCNVKGSSRVDQKRSAQLLVKKWYSIDVTDDESDAICIGKYFADTHNVIGELNW